MSLLDFARGVALGLSIAAPVGPIGVLCIRRTLARGYPNGLASGLGAATADMLYGAVAAFGLTAISGFLIGQRLWIHLIGAVFLGYLGVKTLLAKPPTPTAAQVGALGAVVATPSAAEDPPAGEPASTGAAVDAPTVLVAPAVIVASAGARSANAPRLAGAYSSTLLLTLANPTTILSFVAIFAGVGIVSAPGHFGGAASVVVGVFSGSALWWLLLCGGVSLARRTFSPRALRWISVLSGAILLGFAVFAIVTA